MSKLNLIELNEVNFDLLKKYIEEFPNKYKGLERLIEFNSLTTKSEALYERIEPWIQWPSVHTCKTFDEHQIFRLGDIVNFKGDQIFEVIERLGFKVGCVSPMNAVNNLISPAYFIPDPWTSTESDRSLLSRAVHQAIRQAVNDNSKGKITWSTYLVLLWVLVTKTQIKNWPLYYKLFSLRKKRWHKALFLDLLLADIFIHLKKRKKSDFSCLFLNAFAHVQHHYLLNSSVYTGEILNDASYVSAEDDPVLDAISVYNVIISDLLCAFDESFIFATGLRQVAVKNQVTYYRLRDHKKFISGLGIRNFEVDPRMTRDFLLEFRNVADLNAAEEILRRAECVGTPLFEQVERRHNSLFVTLTFSEPLTDLHIISAGGQTIRLKDEFVFVANKNGHHDGLGYVYSNYDMSMLSDKDHVSKVGKEVVNFFKRDK